MDDVKEDKKTYFLLNMEKNVHCHLVHFSWFRVVHVSSASISACMKRVRSLIAPEGTLLSLWVESVYISGVKGHYQPKQGTVLLWWKWDPQKFSRRLRFVLFDPPNCRVMTHDPLYFTLPWHIQFVKARISTTKSHTFSCEKDTQRLWFWSHWNDWNLVWKPKKARSV